MFTTKFYKIVSIFLTLFIIIGVFIFLPIDATAKTYKDYQYEIIGDGTVEITKYNGTSSTLIIPSKIDDYTVSTIGNYAFENCTSLTNITIPESVIKLGDYAFSGCTELMSISISYRLTNIGDFVFSSCSKVRDVYYVIKDIESFCNASSPAYRLRFDEAKYHLLLNDILLTKVVIPETITEIRYEAFSSCTDITDIIMPNSVSSINSGAFSNCISLESINIPDSVTSIGGEAFCGCKSLKSIIIPKYVDTIYSWAFKDCSNLTSIKVNIENRFFDSRNNCNAIIDSKTDTLLYGCSSTVIPDSIKNISDSAFYNCAELINVTLPDSIKYIPDFAFYGCTGLTSITIPNSVLSINERAFFNCINLKNITIPSSVTFIGEKAFGYYIDSSNNIKRVDDFTVYCYEGSQGYDYGWYNYFNVILLKEINDINKAYVSGIKDTTYNGKAQTQNITIKYNEAKLVLSTDYMITYQNNKNAGTATVIISGTGNYTGIIVKTFTIHKANNPMKVKASAKTVKYKTVKKKVVTVNVITVSKAQGTVSYKKTSGKKFFTVNAKTGKITVKKGTKKGTYSIKVKVTANSNKNYKSGSKTVTVKIKVK